MTKHTYKLIDSGDFRKLEQIGPFRIIRPSPQSVWRPQFDQNAWSKGLAAEFVRHSTGDGEWRVYDEKIKQPFLIEVSRITFLIKLTDFGHLGIFPEQSANWQRLTRICQSSARPLRVLNLFAYTGGSTLACSLGGADVVHIDASKTSVAWARLNAEAMSLSDRPIRWIVEDVKRFVAREVRRKSRYDGIILDPPSYGRGSKSEVWKIETDLPVLLDELKCILSKEWTFLLLSAHSPGYTPVALKNILAQLNDTGDASFLAEEMLKGKDDDSLELPSGNSCWLYRGDANDLKL